MAATPDNSSTYQFGCPSCGSLLQAQLKQELTSVQCGECLDIFDVQLPASGGVPTLTPSAANAGPPVNIEDAKGFVAADDGLGSDGSGERAAKQRRIDDPGASGVEGDAALGDESTTNLESSLQSCTAHRGRILQMLQDDPENANLIELRDQLTNAINQLQGTKTMVQRAHRGNGDGLGGLASAAASAGPSPSSRKNKPQRCSICGGVGHKSRTCSMAQGQPGQAMQPWQPQYIPGGYAPPGMAPANYPGTYVMTQGQQQGSMAPMPHHHPGMAPPRQIEMSSAEGHVMHPEQGMIAHHQPYDPNGADGARSHLPPMAAAVEAPGQGGGMMPAAGMSMSGGAGNGVPSTRGDAPTDHADNDGGLTKVEQPEENTVEA